MNSRFRAVPPALLLLAAPALQAADGYTLQAPVLGHVLDSETGTLHRISGIPGASGIGAALPLDFVVARAAVAPTQDFAIVSDDTGQFSVVNLRVSPPSAVPLEGALPGAEGAVISPTARRAALYSASLGQVQVIDSLRGTPVAGEVLDLAVGVGEWTAFAVSDTGVVLAAAAQDDVGSLFTVRPGTGAERVGAVQRAVDLAFLAGTEDAVVADLAASEVIMVRGVVARRQFSVIASANDGITAPLGAEATSDGRYVAVAMPGGITSVPVFGGQPMFTPCACAPSGLVSLAGGNVFRLTSDIRSPILIAEVGPASRVLFVPALAEAEPLETQ